MQKAGEIGSDDGLDTPTYEEIVQILTFLVDVIEVKIDEKDSRAARDLLTALQASLDGALRLEWDERRLDENGKVLYLD